MKTRECTTCGSTLKKGRKYKPIPCFMSDGRVEIGPVCRRCSIRMTQTCTQAPTQIAPSCSSCKRGLAQYCQACIDALRQNVQELTAANIRLQQQLQVDAQIPTFEVKIQ